MFFTISPKCNSQLKKFGSAQIPRVRETRWNYVSRIISIVRSNREQILECFTSIQNGEGWDRIEIKASVNSLPVRILFSRSRSFKWENMRSTDTCMQGKQLMVRNTGCTIRGYLETISQTFGSFNLLSRSTLTSSSANAVRSDFADAVTDA